MRPAILCSAGDDAGIPAAVARCRACVHGAAAVYAWEPDGWHMAGHALTAVWKNGRPWHGDGPVYVSMNDYLIRRRRDRVRVAWQGYLLRRRWPRTDGALGLWMAAFRLGRRQVSVSVWEGREDLRRFVRSPRHVRVMRTFKDAGLLYTNAWTAERLDRDLIWRQAAERLSGRVAGASHH